MVLTVREIWILSQIRLLKYIAQVSAQTVGVSFCWPRRYFGRLCLAFLHKSASAATTLDLCGLYERSTSPMKLQLCRQVVLFLITTPTTLSHLLTFTVFSFTTISIDAHTASALFASDFSIALIGRP